MLRPTRVKRSTLLTDPRSTIRNVRELRIEPDTAELWEDHRAAFECAKTRLGLGENRDVTVPKAFH